MRTALPKYLPKLQKGGILTMRCGICRGVGGCSPASVRGDGRLSVLPLDFLMMLLYNI